MYLCPHIIYNNFTKQYDLKGIKPYILDMDKIENIVKNRILWNKIENT